MFCRALPPEFRRSPGQSWRRPGPGAGQPPSRSPGPAWGASAAEREAPERRGAGAGLRVQAALPETGAEGPGNSRLPVGYHRIPPGFLAGPLGRSRTATRVKPPTSCERRAED